MRKGKAIEKWRLQNHGSKTGLRVMIARLPRVFGDLAFLLKS